MPDPCNARNKQTFQYLNIECICVCIYCISLSINKIFYFKVLNFESFLIFQRIIVSMQNIDNSKIFE